MTTEKPADETPTNKTPAGKTPASAASVNETPTNETPAGETPASAASVNETPANAKPTKETPASAEPTNGTPVNEDKKSLPWLWIILALLVVAVIVWMLQSGENKEGPSDGNDIVLDQKPQPGGPGQRPESGGPGQKPQPGGPDQRPESGGPDQKPQPGANPEAVEEGTTTTDATVPAVVREVCLFENRNYRGQEKCYRSDQANFVNLEINDKVSSLKLKGGAIAELYEHINYRGFKVTYIEDTPWVGPRDNDKFSSLKIR